MYREGAHEQENLLKSIKRVDEAMKAGTAYEDRLEFESHIFFDGATRRLVMMNDFVLQVRFYLSVAVILSSSGQRCSLDTFCITNVFQHRFLLCWIVSLLLRSQLNTFAFSLLPFIFLLSPSFLFLSYSPSALFIIVLSASKAFITFGTYSAQSQRQDS